jgi:hypothetical protein
MKRVTLRAHFGGQYVRLDEPFELEPATALIVTVLPAAPVTDEDGAWAAAGPGRARPRPTAPMRSNTPPPPSRSRIPNMREGDLVLTPRFPESTCFSRGILRP